MRTEVVLSLLLSFETFWKLEGLIMLFSEQLASYYMWVRKTQLENY